MQSEKPHGQPGKGPPGDGPPPPPAYTPEVHAKLTAIYETFQAKQDYPVLKRDLIDYLIENPLDDFKSKNMLMVMNRRNHYISTFVVKSGFYYYGRM